MKVTLSVIKADVGGYPGHRDVHPRLMEEATKALSVAKDRGTLIDFKVMRCGDDLELIMTHKLGVDNDKIHKLSWDTFVTCTEVAKELKLYGAGQDLLVDAFSGNVKGMGPGVAEMEIEERKSEPVMVFMADKTAPSAWNLPIYKMFADPFNSAGLVIDPTMHGGFAFEVHDVIDHKKITLNTPEETYDLLLLIGAPGRYVINTVHRRSDKEIAAAASTQKLSHIAGKYVGKDDPVLIVRAQYGMPAVGEILEPFSFPYLVQGWMRGSHCGPLVPCAFKQATPSRFDGPPRVICAGFQITNGHLLGPTDMFDDIAFDEVRHQANLAADFMRRHGPFEPHRLHLSEMEYTTLPQVLAKFKDRFEKI